MDMKSSIIERILNDVSLDPRITDGVFLLEENSHMDVLREYLVNKGIDEETVREYTNLVLDGKYPERQAYNQNGILVTFPTPEYKQRAIQRGTHFEKDPTKGKPNLSFGDQQGGEQAPQAPAEPKGEEPATKTNLPLSQAGTAGTPQPDTTKGDEPQATPQTQAAPQQVQSPQEPVAEPEEPAPPPPPPSPEEKEANKDAIQKIFRGDDYMLESYPMINTPIEVKYVKRWLSDIREMAVKGLEKVDDPHQTKIFLETIRNIADAIIPKLQD